MKTTIHTKNYSVSPKMQNIIEKKVEKIQKYFDGDATCTIVCSKVGNTEKMELTIAARGHSFRAQEENRNMYGNIDVVLGKIERQIVKNKEKLRSVLMKEAVDDKRLEFLNRTPKFVAAEVVKNKSFEIKKLSEEEAELGLSTLDHNFFVYANKLSGKVNIMYRRADGHVGVIEIGNAVIKPTDNR